jgi:hypothetical protein
MTVPGAGAAPPSGSPALNLAIFCAFVAVTMYAGLKASKTNKSASDMYTGGAAFSGRQNGVAISGDYLSAASFLGIAGAIALQGYDGFLYSIGFLVAWLIALLLVAELLRNTGRFTMADVLSFRMRERPVRTAAATSTLVVSFFYLLAQMAGAGGLVALLLNIDNRGGQSVIIALVGVLMIVYVLIGGMKGTTYVQMIKAVLLISGAALMSFWVLTRFGFNFSEMLGAGAARGVARARQGVRPGTTPRAELHLAGAGPGARHRRPAAHPDALLHRADGQGGPQLGGLGDLADRPVLPVHADPRLRRRGARRAGADRRRHPARPTRQRRCWPTSSAGRCCWASSRGRLRDDPRGGRRAHDHGVGVVRARHLRPGHQAGEPAARGRGAGRPHRRARGRRRRDPRRHRRQRPEHRVPRGARLRGRRVGEPADDPVLAVLEALQHPRLPVEHLRRSDHHPGAHPVLPAVSGLPTSMLPDADFSWFPLANPGLVSIPASFLLGYLGTVTSKEYNAAKYAEMEVRSLTGAGSSNEVAHH